MSEHDDACEDSRELCDELFHQLARLIPNLQRSQTAGWCSFNQDGCKRFAYVDHRKKLAHIDVWCLGNLQDFSAFPGLPFIARSPTSSGWSKFQVHIGVNSLPDAALLARALHQISNKWSK